MTITDRFLPRSDELNARLHRMVPGGAHTYAKGDDQYPEGLAPVIAHGRGAHVWDVDGNEYSDFHNGFGVVCVGHANPQVAAAVKVQAERGTHFAAPTEGSIIVAEELVRRFKLPQWRFTNSGTESTMDAVHL
ncbi:MAG: aminotransferase class III-fold pyridoxal phosphate-dependent enzyme, partial [Pseudonocardiaceae bacterium]